ncbi:metallophosphoesterase family protein [Acuticoccus mangrovi]|uniref:Serine/threonine protein phosphatase n=1 Tax=Acuticoccus mangrovi TaxID=2796142 RepID=A0A934ITH9_9HYPH|nr:metallophosphoesterase family protein [Acuticoccus mangrovi]MBJ3778328.1 serine/threonine protein phosphatase [Acuticoccus mangrovi]
MSVRLPDGHRVYAVGDIHGCDHLLERLMGLIAEDLAASPAEHVTELFVGDYVDRGRDSYAVIEFLRGPATPGRERVCLLGNHEVAMLDALRDGSLMARWLVFGAEATLRAYGIEARQYAHNPVALQPMLQAVLPEEHRAFLEQRPVTHRIGDVLFVHAGIRPGVPLEAQERHDLIWIREEFLNYTGPLPVHVVHGHTPVDAPDHRPWRTNIDTGAVYGGALTAAVLENGSVRFLSVPAD